MIPQKSRTVLAPNSLFCWRKSPINLTRHSGAHMLMDIMLPQAIVEEVLLIVKSLRTTEGKQATTQVMTVNAAPFSQQAIFLVLLCKGRITIRTICCLGYKSFPWFSNYSNRCVLTPIESPSSHLGISNLYSATRGFKAQIQWAPV